MSEKSNDTAEESSQSTSIKVETLNEDIKQLVDRINAFVDIEFKIKQAEKKDEHSINYKRKCIKSIDAAKSNCEKATKYYHDLRVKTENANPENFRKKFFQLNTKNSDTNKVAAPIDEWDLGLDCWYKKFTKPLYAEAATSRVSRSIFMAKHHYVHGRSHTTMNGALAHHSYLSSVHEELETKSEMQNAVLRLKEDCVQKNFDKIEQSLKPLYAMEQECQHEYDQYVATFKEKLKEFETLYNKEKEDEYGYEHWWDKLHFRSRKSDSVKMAHPEDLTTFDTPTPYGSMLIESLEPSAQAQANSAAGPSKKVNFVMPESHKVGAQMPPKVRFCMYCDKKMEYRQVNPCEWRCVGCTLRTPLSQPGASPSEEADIKKPMIISDFLDSIRKSHKQRPEDSNSNAEGSEVLTVTEPLGSVDDNCQPIYVGPKGGKAFQPDNMHPLERMFQRNI